MWSKEWSSFQLKNRLNIFFSWLRLTSPVSVTTVAPCYNEPRYNEDPVILSSIWNMFVGNQRFSL